MDYHDDLEELEPGEFDRLVGLFAAGLIMADLIAHPEGARALAEAIDG